jgi:type II secretory pathway component PulJ
MNLLKRQKIESKYKSHRLSAFHFTLYAHSGFTLVEVFISLAIFVSVMVAITAFLINIYSNNRTASGSFQTAQDAQVILKTMLTQLRQASTAVNGAYPIAIAGTSSITFFSDVNNDGLTDEVTYSLIGSTLYSTVIKASGSPFSYNMANQATSSILTNVRNSSSTPVFQYYDQNYTGTSSPLSLPINIPAIRLIKISLALDVLVNQAPAVRTYTTSVSLRDLKTNL